LKEKKKKNKEREGNLLRIKVVQLFLEDALQQVENRQCTHRSMPWASVESERVPLQERKTRMKEKSNPQHGVSCSTEIENHRIDVLLFTRKNQITHVAFFRSASQSVQNHQRGSWGNKFPVPIQRNLSTIWLYFVEKEKKEIGKGELNFFSSLFQHFGVYLEGANTLWTIFRKKENEKNEKKKKKTKSAARVAEPFKLHKRRFSEK
jgi:hypothetical protein